MGKKQMHRNMFMKQLFETCSNASAYKPKFSYNTLFLFSVFELSGTFSYLNAYVDTLFQRKESTTMLIALFSVSVIYILHTYTHLHEGNTYIK